MPRTNNSIRIGTYTGIRIRFIRNEVITTVSNEFDATGTVIIYTSDMYIDRDRERNEF